MRLLLRFVLVGLVAVACMPSVASAAVPITVDRKAAAVLPPDDSRASCGGPAPVITSCTATFVLDTDNVGAGTSSLVYYEGSITITLTSESATWTVNCLVENTVLSFRVSCGSQQPEGEFHRGQTVTLSATASGTGYWETSGQSL